MLEKLKDWWITWRTGKTKDVREYEAWYFETVNYRANSINNLFKNFKHVIIVDHNKFLDMGHPFIWVPNDDAKQYFWPNRDLGNTAVWRWERVIWSNYSNQWYLNELGGTDTVFVATNNDYDAMMIALKYQ